MKERLRLCIGCRGLFNSGDLIQIKFNNNKIFINPGFYLSGRSTYLCYNIKCIESVKKYKKLEKSFKNKIRITDKVWDVLNNIIEVKQNNLSLSLEIN